MDQERQVRGGEVMGRVYLHVPFEERFEVQRLGARWDEPSKCWFIDTSQDGVFRKWLDTPEATFSISSDEAYVASAKATCWRCQASIEVVCLYCESGEVHGDIYSGFTVSDITAVDDALAAALRPWPSFAFVADSARGGRCYLVNRCSACGAVQRDYFLHCEPAGPFFIVKAADPGSIRLTRIPGRVCLSGDEGFEP
jgi:hypothetical protein